MFAYIIPITSLGINHVKQFGGVFFFYFTTEKGGTINYAFIISFIHIVWTVFLFNIMVCVPTDISKWEMFMYFQLIKVINQ